MPKQAISVTLAAENLLWLRGQARASGGRSVSDILDRLVSASRASGRVQETSIRSVVGTVRIAANDPDLAGADAAIRVLFPAAARTRAVLGRRGEGEPRARTRKGLR